MSKIALVLSGGGAKGAYQVGVWKALVEFGIDKYIDTISATSIGSINAILFSSYKVNDVIEIWSRLTRGIIAPIRLREVSKIIKRRSICDKKPLIRFIGSIIDNSQFDKNKFNILVTCSNLKYLYPKKEIYNLNNMFEHASDIVAASCSIPCVYNHHRINGKGIFFDGGINSRTPVDSLNKKDYDYIIIVHNDNIGRINFIKYFGRNIINIYPSFYQGGIYTGTYGFDKKYIKKKINRGYKDAQNVIKKYNLDRLINEEIY